MLLGPLSELCGRRPIYLLSWTLYIIFLIPQLVAKNIATMVVFRLLDGLLGSTFLAVSGGTIRDLFSRKELRAPMAVFSVSPFIGPSLGPLVGGFINYYADWRWTYYVLIIWSVPVWLAVVLFVPETFRKFHKTLIEVIRSN
jgi:multidrug resistance protein